MKVAICNIRKVLDEIEVCERKQIFKKVIFLSTLCKFSHCLFMRKSCLMTRGKSQRSKFDLAWTKTLCICDLKNKISSLFSYKERNNPQFIQLAEAIRKSLKQFDDEEVVQTSAALELFFQKFQKNEEIELCWFSKLNTVLLIETRVSLC